MQRFEDLIACQKARELTKSVYISTRVGSFAKDFGLASQVQRASVSIMANIAEGFERNRDAEFHQFLSVAKASCAEVRSHLYVALDAGHLSQPTFDEILALAQEVSRVVGGLRASIERRRDSSTQHSALSTQHLP
ncbi:MAG: four helix bundle protein [Tepidiformaceae bacterium]